MIKTLQNAMKQDREGFDLPRSVQDAIPIRRLWPDGIFQFGSKFSKTIRRGLLTGTEKLQGQLRDAAEGGRREETEVERAQNSAKATTRQAVNQLGKLAHGKKKTHTGKEESPADAGKTNPDIDLTQYKNQQNVGSIYRDYNQEQVSHMQVSKQADMVYLSFSFKGSKTWE